MIRTEERTITTTKKGEKEGAVMGLNPKYLSEIGLHPGKKYTVVYDGNTKTVSILNDEIEPDVKV